MQLLLIEVGVKWLLLIRFCFAQINGKFTISNRFYLYFHLDLKHQKRLFTFVFDRSFESVERLALNLISFNGY